MHLHGKRVFRSWKISFQSLKLVFNLPVRELSVVHSVASPSSMDMLSAPFVFNELQYNIQYWYSSFSDAYSDGVFLLM